MKSRIKWAIILTLVSILVLNSYYIGSIVVMKYYNDYNVKKSHIDYDMESIEIKKPDGKWYPLVNKFNSSGFADYVNEDIELMIMYSYGDFKMGTSTLFDSNSTQFNSFYGCYIIESNEDGYFGYDDSGEIQIDKIAMIPEYDFKYLVAGAMGLEEKDFLMEYSIDKYYKTNKGDCLEIEIRTNSIYHSYKSFNLNYIQYGIPFAENGREDFYPIDIYSKMMIEKVENNTIIVYYIFTPIWEMMDNWHGGINEGLYN